MVCCWITGLHPAGQGRSRNILGKPCVGHSLGCRGFSGCRVYSHSFSGVVVGILTGFLLVYGSRSADIAPSLQQVKHHFCIVLQDFHNDN